MKILLVEDDHQQEEQIVAYLSSEFPSAEVRTISTEQEFRSQLDMIEQHPPDVVVLDVMLRWTDSKPGMEVRPVEVQEGGIFQAGIRCQEMLATRARTRGIPVILYTLLERADLGNRVQQVVHVTKESSQRSLFHAIRQLIRR